MHKAVIAIAVLLLAAQVRAPRRPAPGGAAGGPAVVDRDIAVFFSPDDHCIDGIVWQIQAARRSIDVQAFMLTTQRITEPLIAAQSRGVAVRVIFDAEQAADNFSLDEDLVRAGIPVWLDSPAGGRAHDKVMIIDGETVVTGSFNFTLAADQKNSENLIVIRQRPAIAQGYQRHFDARLAEARKHPLARN